MLRLLRAGRPLRPLALVCSRRTRLAYSARARPRPRSPRRSCAAAFGAAAPSGAAPTLRAAGYAPRRRAPAPPVWPGRPPLRAPTSLASWRSTTTGCATAASPSPPARGGARAAAASRRRARPTPRRARRGRPRERLPRRAAAVARGAATRGETLGVALLALGVYLALTYFSARRARRALVEPRGHARAARRRRLLRAALAVRGGAAADETRRVARALALASRARAARSRRGRAPAAARGRVPAVDDARRAARALRAREGRSRAAHAPAARRGRRAGARWWTRGGAAGERRARARALLRDADDADARAEAERRLRATRCGVYAARASRTRRPRGRVDDTLRARTRSRGLDARRREGAALARAVQARRVRRRRGLRRARAARGDGAADGDDAAARRPRSPTGRARAARRPRGAAGVRRARERRARVRAPRGGARPRDARGAPTSAPPPRAARRVRRFGPRARPRRRGAVTGDVATRGTLATPRLSSTRPSRRRRRAREAVARVRGGPSNARRALTRARSRGFLRRGFASWLPLPVSDPSLRRAPTTSAL